MAIAVEVFCALMTVAGLVYMVLALRAIRVFVKRPRFEPVPNPPTISILKPMKGAEPGLYDALRTHCLQQYAGRYEIVFGVASLQDPAVAEVERLRVEFPNVAMRVIECSERLGTSGKVSNLAQMLPHALGEVIVVNDADIHVSPHYLAHLAAAFVQQGERPTGLVTAMYHGTCVAPATFGAKLEALTLSTEFLPGLLTARMMEGGIRFGLGSTLAARREALDAIGGFAPLVNHLADDYEVGARIYAAGYRVEFCEDIVETTVPRYTLKEFWEHQLRWIRTVRDARPGGYFGLVVSYVVPWSLFTCVASGFELWSFTLLSFVLLARIAVALTAGVGILRDGQVLRDLWLIPVRDCYALLLWAWSYAGDTVVWRGERFHLDKGKLIAVEQRVSELAS